MAKENLNKETPPKIVLVYSTAKRYTFIDNIEEELTKDSSYDSDKTLCDLDDDLDDDIVQSA
jgi:hypothetical protein